MIPAVMEHHSFQLIPCRAHRPADRPFLFAIEGRRYILSAGKEEPVKVLCHISKFLFCQMKRKNDGNSTGFFNGIHVSRQHPDTFLFFVPQRHNPDLWLSHHQHLLFDRKSSCLLYKIIIHSIPHKQKDAATGQHLRRKQKGTDFYQRLCLSEILCP